MKLQEIPRLRPLTEHARRLHIAALWVQERLPASLRASCRLLNIRDGRVILACTDSATAFQARFQSRALLDALAPHWPEPLNQLSVRVLPEPRPPTRAPSPRRLSPEAREALAHAARDVDYAPLAQALEKLSRARNRR